MIQRKQSLFLLAAVIAYLICLFMPVAVILPKGMGEDILVHNLGTVSGTDGLQFVATCLPLFLFLAVSAVMAIATIFLYKNRKQQMTLCSVIILFSVIWYVDYALMVSGVVGLPNVEGTCQVKWAACLPLVAIILVAMARKGVSDDEKLVRAADRIR